MGNNERWRSLCTVLIEECFQESMISKSFESTNDTIISIKYKSGLSGGEKFTIIVGGNEVFLQLPYRRI